MDDKNKKQAFDWEPGKKLSSDNYEPVGKVRDVGFTKLADGLLADPEKRKEVRSKKLAKLSKAPKDEGLIVEESHSGLKDDFAPSKASKLLENKPGKMQGVLAYDNKKKSTVKKKDEN